MEPGLEPEMGADALPKPAGEEPKKVPSGPFVQKDGVAV